MPTYTAPTRDTRFVLNEMLELASYGNLPGFENATQDMIDTMDAMPGVGLAAPQIGVMLQLAVVDASSDRKKRIRLANPGFGFMHPSRASRSVRREKAPEPAPKA